MKPELIYYEKYQEKIHFCITPEENDKHEIMDLADFLLEHTDLDDKGAAELVYCFLEMVSSDSIDFDRILIKSEDQIINKELSRTEIIIDENLIELGEYDTADTNNGNNIEKPKITNKLLFFLSSIVLIFIFGLTRIKILEQYGIKREVYVVFGTCLISILAVFIKMRVSEYWSIGSINKKEDNTVCFDELNENTSLIKDENRGNIYIKGEYGGNEISLNIDKNPYIIGKSEKKSDGVINCPEISRIHLMIKKEDEEFYIMDLGSKNGTILNGNTLIPHETYRIKNKDTILLALVKLTFIDTSED